MSDRSLSDAPFVVVARHRSVSSGEDVAVRSAFLFDAAHASGALAVHAVEALTGEADRFVISYWSDRADVEDYFDSLGRHMPGLSANADQTELRSAPTGAGPAAFHALVTIRLESARYSV